MCQFAGHVRVAFQKDYACIKPEWLSETVKAIARFYNQNEQEDAHEFLIHFVDAMEQACENGCTLNENSLTREDTLSRDTTTLIRHIFGGQLTSQVQCMNCSTRSDKLDPFMDLSVQIKEFRCLEEALSDYTKAEKLESGSYICGTCRGTVDAVKKTSIHKASNVLAIHFKRFEYDGTGSCKIKKNIKFTETLNLQRYMSPEASNEPVLYSLYGVIVHIGPSATHGHYYCYVKSPSKTWHRMDDGVVKSVSRDTVLQDEAYVLFYIRDNQAPNETTTSIPSSKKGENVKFNGAAKKHGKHEPLHHNLNGTVGGYSAFASPVKSQYGDNGSSFSRSADRYNAHDYHKKATDRRNTGPCNPNRAASQYNGYNNSMKGAAARSTGQANLVNGTGAKYTTHNGRFNGTASSHAGRYTPVNGTNRAHSSSDTRVRDSGDFSASGSHLGASSHVPQPTDYSPSGGTALPQQRKKISFCVKQKAFQPDRDQASQTNQRKDSENNSPQKRIVMQITKGTVKTLERSSDGKESVVKASSIKTTLTPLVPYDPNSDSEESSPGPSGGNSHLPDHEQHRDQSEVGNTRDFPVPHFSNMCNGENRYGEGKGADSGKTGEWDSLRSQDVTSKVHTGQGEKTISDMQSATSGVPPQKYCDQNEKSSCVTPAVANNGGFHSDHSEFQASDAEAHWKREPFSSSKDTQRNVRAGSLDKISTVKPQKRSSSLEPMQRHTEACLGNRASVESVSASFGKTADKTDLSNHASNTCVQNSFHQASDTMNSNDFIAQNVDIQQADFQHSQQMPAPALSSSCSKGKARKKKKRKHRKNRERDGDQDVTEDSFYHHSKKRKHRHDYLGNGYNENGYNDRWSRQQDSSVYDRGNRHSDIYLDYDYQPFEKHTQSERMKEPLFQEEKAVEDHRQEKHGPARHYGRDGDWSHANGKSEGNDRPWNGMDWSPRDYREWRKGNNYWRRAEEESWKSQRYQNHNSSSRNRWRKNHTSHSTHGWTDHSHHEQSSFQRTSSSDYYRDYYDDYGFSGSHYYGHRQNYSYHRHY